MASTLQEFSLGSDLQGSVAKFASALGTPHRLLRLAPKSAGNPGNAAALKKNVPPATSVLRPKTSGKASLDRSGAKSCARIYSLGAQHVADVLANDLDRSLDWSELPEFV
jgi:hypothetical protein